MACKTKCDPMPKLSNSSFVCPTGSWPSVDSALIGSLIERMAKPIAKAMKLSCIDERGELKPESGCAKRRNALNKIMFPT